MLLERQGGNLAVTGVALVIAVGEPRCKFSQIALPDCLTAQRTERDCGRGVLPFTKTNFMCRLPVQFSWVWTRAASRQQRKLQMRSLQRKFIGEPPRCNIRYIRRLERLR